jgi:hypothetical protein
MVDQFLLAEKMILICGKLVIADHLMIFIAKDQ